MGDGRGLGYLRPLAHYLIRQRLQKGWPKYAKFTKKSDPNTPTRPANRILLLTSYVAVT